ncbi:MAG: amidase family protein, partial [Pseudomonadales bacterium]|nr:amidase family protein [Pseudomonadales bacterium]
MDAFESGLALAERIRRRELSCVDALEFYLERAKRHNETLNAIVEFREDASRAEARELDAALVRGEIRGPLHGVPMTVKESYDVAGMRTTRGNTIWKDHVADADALSITRLKNAGVVIFGKT